MEEQFDPNSLYAGSSSVFGNEQPQDSVKQQIETQKRQRNDLLPVAKDILEYINKEKTNISNLESFVFEKIENPQDLLDDLRARKIYLAYLREFEKWITLRLSNTTKKK